MKSKPKQKPSSNIVAFPTHEAASAKAPLFAALDLGTNSCRMLIARPNETDFEVIDAFSKTVFLGKGLDKTGRLSKTSIKRAIWALNVCAGKLRKHNVRYKRLVATAASRQARNGKDFIKQVKNQTGLKLEIIKPQEEARLAVIASAAHLRPTTEQVLVFDIGGGSTELVWLDLSNVKPDSRRQSVMRLSGSLRDLKRQNDLPGVNVVDWISVPFGVTTLREQFSDVDGDKARYAMMSWYFEEYLTQFGPFGENYEGQILPNFQVIGTSGTVTTIAASHMGLERYDRKKVDGYRMSSSEVEDEIERYLMLGPKWRAQNPSIGEGRKDLIMSGAAILQAILRVWPTEILSVADRGLREGILYSQMVSSGYLR